LEGAVLVGARYRVEHSAGLAAILDLLNSQLVPLRRDVGCRSMRLRLTRGSVAMGDDADAPHEQERDFPADMTIRDVVEAVVAGGYLASVQGDRATWVVRTGSGTPLAVVAQQWGPEPRMLGGGHGSLGSLVAADGSVRLHFAYLAPRDPDAVHRELSAG
jgi:hypothetical protein